MCSAARSRSGKSFAEKLAGELLNAVGINTSFRIITVMLGMSAAGCSSKSEIVALIPEEMALELENIHPSPGRP